MNPAKHMSIVAEIQERNELKLQALRAENAALKEQLAQLESENTNLLAANRDCIDHFNALDIDYKSLQSKSAALVDAAQQCRLDLLHQLDELADHIERASPSIADSDMRKQINDQRDYALNVAFKWRRNGNMFAALAEFKE